MVNRCSGLSGHSADATGNRLQRSPAEHFGIRRMTRLPTEVVKEFKRWQEHVRGDIVFATDQLLAHHLAVEVTPGDALPRPDHLA